MSTNVCKQPWLDIQRHAQFLHSVHIKVLLNSAFCKKTILYTHTDTHIYMHTAYLISALLPNSYINTYTYTYLYMNIYRG